MAAAQIMAALPRDVGGSHSDGHFSHKHAVQCGMSSPPSTSSKHKHGAQDNYLSSSLSDLNKDFLIFASMQSVIFLNYSETLVQNCALKLIKDGKLVNSKTLLLECDAHLQPEPLFTVDFSKSSDVETFEMGLSSSSCDQSSCSNQLPYQLPSSSSLAADHTDRHTSLKSAFSCASVNTIPCSALDDASCLPNFNPSSSAVTCDNNSVLSDITQDDVDGFHQSSVDNISIDGLEGWDGTMGCLPTTTLPDSYTEQPGGVCSASPHQSRSSRMSISLPNSQIKADKHDNSISALKSTNSSIPRQDGSYTPDVLNNTSLALNCQNSSRGLQENVLDDNNNSTSLKMGNVVHSESEKMGNAVHSESEKMGNAVHSESEKMGNAVHSESEKMKKPVSLETEKSHSKMNTSSENRALVSTCIKLLEQEHVLLQKSRLCSGCSSVPKDVTFLPCGHFTMCRSCAEPVYVCPLCKSSILATVDTYLS